MTGRSQIWDGAQWIDLSNNPGSKGDTGATGPPGTGGEVSADAGNQAILGTDSLVYVPEFADGVYLKLSGGLLLGLLACGDGFRIDNQSPEDSFYIGNTPLGGVGQATHVLAWDSGTGIVSREVFVGWLLDSNYQSGSDTPGGSPTIMLTYTVTGLGGQRITVDCVGSMRSSAMDEGEGFQAQINIDGSAFMNARTKFGDVTASSHTHSVAGHDVQGTSGTSSGHLHDSGSYNGVGGTSGGTTVGINVSDGESTVTALGLRTFTPAGNFDVTLVAEIRGGSPTTFFQNLIVKVFSA